MMDNNTELKAKLSQGADGMDAYFLMADAARALDDVEAELAAAQAVVAAVNADMHLTQMTSNPDDPGAYVLGRDAEHALSAAPTDVYDAAIRRARAEAHDEAVAMVCEMVGVPNVNWPNRHRDDVETKAVS